MDVFDLDRSLIDDYSKFARSFATIRTIDIRERVAAIYDSGQFWPDPLISINPHFELGASIEELVAQGTLAEETGRVFRSGGWGLRLHLHQAQALSKATAGKSFVVTTGTGSGKSATMASEGGEAEKKAAVARVASRLFGTAIGADAVIDESLRRATDEGLDVASTAAVLGECIDGNFPGRLSGEQLRAHPLAVWVELTPPAQMARS